MNEDTYNYNYGIIEMHFNFKYLEKDRKVSIFTYYTYIII